MKTKKPAKRKHSSKSSYVVPKGKALVLRTCDANLRSHGGFQWPKSGPVECIDWNPKAECGNGLHGLLWGEGDGTLLSFESSAVWMVVEIDPTLSVGLEGKIKFQNGNVVFAGERFAAVAFLSERADPGRAIVSGTATAGDRGTATAGDRGTATAGDSGTATAGDSGTATAGDRGTATAGYRGTARSGDFGIVVCRWYDEALTRYRLTVGYVGEDGIEPNTFYKCDYKGKLVKA